MFGVGPADADLMFIGEGPGRDEDRQGEPFVGRAGRLLNEMIEKCFQRRRADVYITNIVKCWPPGNRNPQADEVATCLPFLKRQIASVRPRVICLLGERCRQGALPGGPGYRRGARHGVGVAGSRWCRPSIRPTCCAPRGSGCSS